MNTTKLKRFATEARNKLRQGVEKRLAMLGFDDAGIPAESPKLVSGGAVWKDKPCTVAFYNGFKSLEEQIRRYGVSHVVEEAAYTWFNRLMAIRILTMNELCEPVLRYVGSTRTPLIVDEARQGHLPEMDAEDREALMTLIDDDTKTAEQFAMLISAFCHNTPIIEKCFSIMNNEYRIMNNCNEGSSESKSVINYSLYDINYYPDVLFPANILSENGFIDMLNTTDFITEEDYHSSELLGWLYQFYISEKKDQVFAKKGKYDADDIPAATQIFTPNWIVKYMVQNAVIPQVISYSEYRISEGEGIGDREYRIGKLRALKKKYKYLVLPPELDAEGHLSTIHSNLSPKADLSPEEDLLTIHYSLSLKKDLELLKVADLACGSGHILNECFDLLYDLYISEGYTRREAIECIFTQNLTGIDIDTRAKQLATFALMLKACQRDPSLVDASLMPHVYDMSGMPEESRELGSIQIFDEPDSDNPVIAALSTHYDAIVMNPPYMGGGSMSQTLSNYVKTNYSKGKADLATVFVEAMPRLTKEGGKYAFIIPPSWMFLRGFESLRKSIIENQSIDSLLHLSRGIFGADFGSSSAVITNEKDPHAKGNYFRLIERTFQEFDQKHLRILFEKTLVNPDFRFKFKEYTKDVKEIVFSKDGSIIYYPSVSQKEFKKIPGTPIAYWVSDKIRETFTTNLPLSAVCKPTQGLATADNGRFVRSWFEVAVTSIGFGCESASASVASGRKFFPYNKGGAIRKWYGNRELVVNWENDGQEIRMFPASVIRNPSYYFKEGITFPRIGSGQFSARYVEPGFVFDCNGPTCFPDFDNFYALGFLNSNVMEYLVKILCPTISFQIGDSFRVPYIHSESADLNQIVEKSISISKTDWDAHETSWDFEKNPLLAVDVQTYQDNIDAQIENFRQGTEEFLCIDPTPPQLNSLKWRYEQYCQKWESLFMKLHANEEELNRRFIEIYGLQDELTPDVPLNEVTILQQGEIDIVDNEYRIMNNEGDGGNPKTKHQSLINYSLSPIIFNSDVVMKQFISYAVGCMMGRYRLDRPGLAIAHPNETPEEVAEYPIMNNLYRIMNNCLPAGMTHEVAMQFITKHHSEAIENPDGSYTLYDIRYKLDKFWIDDDGIIPLMPEDCGFHDNAVNRFATFVRQTLGDETQVENLNFIEECLGKSLEQYFIKDFWKDHKKMYQNRPIYWLFASKKGAFQVLVYVHRMNVATVERIRSRYLLPYIERLNKRIEDLQANESTLSTKQRNQLKTLRAQVAECEEYHNRLAVVAERGIVPNLDDGIIKNHALYGDIVTKIK